MADQYARAYGLLGWLPRVAAWTFAATLFGAVIIFVVHTGDFATFVRALRHASASWILVALGCQAGTYLCAAAVWHLVLRRTGSHIRLRSLFRLAFIELFANQSIPTGGISGNVMVMHGLTRRGVNPAVAMVALLLAALSYYLAYLLVGTVALYLLWRGNHVSFGVIALFIAFIAVVAGAIILVYVVSRMRPAVVSLIVQKWQPFAHLIEILETIESKTFKDIPLVLMAVCFQAAVFVLDAATLWCTSFAVGLDLDFATVFTSFILASIVATLSPLPLGLGTFEGTCVSLLHIMGAGLEESLAATLLLRGLILWLPMIPGLWLMKLEAIPRKHRLDGKAVHAGHLK